MRRQGFSLVELLVVITIILMLMAMMGAAVSGLRNTNKQRATRATIDAIDNVMRALFQTYADRRFPSTIDPQERAARLRKMVSADLPDRWVDVEYMAENAGSFNTPRQQAYITYWKTLQGPRNPDSQAPEQPTADYAGAECLFMIIMVGGVADCLDCSDLAQGVIGDKDGDGALEFHDAWGNPIGYILWPGGLRLPNDSSLPFFSQSPAFTPDAIEQTIRPLIYSGGPDGVDGRDGNDKSGNADDNELKKQAAGQFGFRIDVIQLPDEPPNQEGRKIGYLHPSIDCGTPKVYPGSLFGRPFEGAADNMTNLDVESKP